MKIKTMALQEKPPSVDEKAVKLFQIAADNLGDVFANGYGRDEFTEFIKQQGLLANHESDETLKFLNALDKVAFYMEAGNRQEKYEDKYLSKFEPCKTSQFDLKQWCKMLDAINADVERDVVPNDAKSRKLFSGKKDRYLKMQKRCREAILSCERISLTAKHIQAKGDVSEINHDLQTKNGAIFSSVTNVESKDGKVGGINSKASAGMTQYCPHCKKPIST